MGYFKPWIGGNYDKTRTLLMSESTYNWLGEDGKTWTPQSNHPMDSIEWNIINFQSNKYFTEMNRALCGKQKPTAEEMRLAWENYAYTIFVQEPVGLGAGIRPNKEHWQDAGDNFLSVIESLRPEKVIITGKDMWDSMPECSVRLLDDLQAYKLSDESLVWCLALPHPANRVKGFSWEVIGTSIQVFNATKFPAHASQLN